MSCKFCSKNNPECLVDNDKLYILVDKEKLRIAKNNEDQEELGFAMIEYCPICGRGLTYEARNRQYNKITGFLRKSLDLAEDTLWEEYFQSEEDLEDG